MRIGKTPLDVKIMIGSIKFGHLKIRKADFDRLDALANKESDEDLAMLARIVVDILNEIERQDCHALEQSERDAWR